MFFSRRKNTDPASGGGALRTHFPHHFHNGFGLFQDHFGHAHFRLVHAAIHGAFDVRLQDVIDREAEGLTGQRTRPCRIPFGDRQCIELTAVRRRSTQDNDYIPVADALNGPFDFLLTFQVNAAC